MNEPAPTLLSGNRNELLALASEAMSRQIKEAMTAEALARSSSPLENLGKLNYEAPPTVAFESPSIGGSRYAPMVQTTEGGVLGYTRKLQEAMMSPLQPGDMLFFRSRPMAASLYDGILPAKPLGGKTAVPLHPDDAWGVRWLEGHGKTKYVSDLDLAGGIRNGQWMDAKTMKGIWESINTAYGSKVIQHLDLIDGIRKNNPEAIAAAEKNTLVFGFTHKGFKEYGAFAEIMQKYEPGANKASPASGIHPDYWASVSGGVNIHSAIRALRQSGAPEALATAKLIKRGDVNVVFKDTDPWGQGAAGRKPWGKNSVEIYLDRVSNLTQVAGFVTHETKHVLQRTTPSTHYKDHEVEAYLWQRAADPIFRRSTSVDSIVKFVDTDPLYGQFRWAPNSPWKPKL